MITFFHILTTINLLLGSFVVLMTLIVACSYIEDRLTKYLTTTRLSSFQLSVICMVVYVILLGVLAVSLMTMSISNGFALKGTADFLEIYFKK